MNNVRYNVNKYFAINNVIGVVDEDNNLYMSVVNDDNQKIWIDLYANNELKSNGGTINFIVSFNSNGTIKETIYDASLTLNIPELSDGMFGKWAIVNEDGSLDIENNNNFIIANQKVVYQDGTFDFLDDVINNTINDEDVVIISIFGHNTTCFNSLEVDTPIWINPIHKKEIPQSKQPQ